MSGYLQFKHTGVESIDFILQAIEDAGDAYHHTADWEESSTWGSKGPSHKEKIQLCADLAAIAFRNKNSS